MGSRKPAMQRTINTRVYADYAEDDLLLRSAFDDKITVSRFKRLLREAAKRDSSEQPNYPMLMGTLTAKRNSEKLRALMDHYNGDIISYNSSADICGDICEMLAIAILSKKLTVAKQLLEEHFSAISFNYNYFSEPDLRCQPCYNPLYYIMLTKQYDLVSFYMDLLKKAKTGVFTNQLNVFAIHLDIDLTFISALLYEEDEFIKELFDCGYRPSSDVFAELAAYPFAINRYRTKFFSYYFPERKKPPKLKNFISRIMTDDERYEFVGLVYKKFGKENADSFFEGIDFPKITSVSAAALINERKNRDDLFDESEILWLIDDTLYIDCGMENAFSAVRENLRVFGEKELIYIISGKEPDYHRFRGVSNKLIRLFLQQRLMFDFDGSCPSFLRFILSRNDKSITALAVSQGMITKKNLTSVIDFLSEKHFFVALNALYAIDYESFQ